jgi:hypothetical protein
MTRAMHFRLAIRSLVALAVVSMAAGAASAEWKENVLYSFQGGPTDGALPVGKMVFDSKGNLYGATTQGGGECPPAQCGAVFELTPPAKNGDPWTETVLHIFKGIYNGNPLDGNVPAGGIVIDGAGNLYGTTGYGGTGSCVLSGTKVGCGTVYELSPPTRQGGTWTETVLYSFQSGKDGYLPWGDLIFDAKGNLYGATEYGGGYGSCNSPYYQYCGTVFEVSPSKKNGGAWTEKVLYSFKSGMDGANPNGGLIFDAKRTIYGTTQFGGNDSGDCGSGGCGTVFDLKPPTKKNGAWSERVLYRFKSGPDASEPVAGLVSGGGGSVYGTTLGGGNSGLGAVFQLKRGSGSAWIEKVLYRFSDGSDGANPMGPLTFAANGSLYGTALGGGTHRGVVFHLNPPKRGNPWSLSVLYNLKGSPDGDHPTTGLTLDKKGDLYSTTQWGGTGQSCQGGCGTVFETRP